MAAQPVRVAIVGGHPVIIGVIRLACNGQPDVLVAAEVAAGGLAPAIIISGRVDVLVLDLELPDVDGLEVLRQLRGDGWDGAVLAVSDRTDGATVLEALRLGADGYLTKADGLRQIGVAIRTVAQGGRVLDPALEEAAILELGRFARQVREGAEVVEALTAREREILDLLSEGLTMQQIGRRLGISPRTVETHVSKLYRKLGVKTRVQAIARAASLGLVEFR